jgi:hypothetical protein
VNDNPEVTLTPFRGGFPITYFIFWAGVATVAVVAFFLMRGRGTKKYIV